jgi:hypothetical protein
MHDTFDITPQGTGMCTKYSDLLTYCLSVIHILTCVQEQHDRLVVEDDGWKTKSMKKQGSGLALV